jgi:hypothetical protein
MLWGKKKKKKQKREGKAVDLHGRNFSIYENKLKRCICSAYFLMEDQGMQHITTSTGSVSSGWFLKAYFMKGSCCLICLRIWISFTAGTSFTHTDKQRNCNTSHHSLFRRYHHHRFGSLLERKLNPTFWLNFTIKLEQKKL